MPYLVTSRCTSCTNAARFCIGNWAEHAGIWACPDCRGLRNVAVDTMACCGCGRVATEAALIDHTGMVAHFSGASPSRRRKAPSCQQCGSPQTLQATGHLTIRPHRRHTIRPQHTTVPMELAIFLRSLRDVAHTQRVPVATLLHDNHLAVDGPMTLSGPPSELIAADIAAKHAAATAPP